MNPRLRVDGLRIHDVGPVSFHVDPGTCVGVFGPSGAGKTLLLRAISDMAPDASAFDRLGLEADILGWPVSRLSTGERQRLALLRLLQNDPCLLLLDEPTANLDSANTARVEDMVCANREKTSAGVLWIGHRQDQLQRVALRIVGLPGGRLESDGGA